MYFSRTGSKSEQTDSFEGWIGMFECNVWGTAARDAWWKLHPIVEKRAGKHPQWVCWHKWESFCKNKTEYRWDDYEFSWRSLGKCGSPWKDIPHCHWLVAVEP